LPAAEAGPTKQKGTDMGPVQVLVVGFGPDAEFKGKALAELKRLTAAEVVRLIDLLFVRKNEDGRVEKIEIADMDELADLGALAGGLLGLGAAGEAGAEVGAEAGAEALTERGSVFDDEQVWYLADDLPVGDIVAIAVLEHTWAIPLRNAIAEAGGVAIGDHWLHPADLVSVGREIGLAVEND
jgi:hypothetical protein